MASTAPLIDSMLKEYLLFRGFTATLKSLESEIKADKDKSFRVEKVVDQIQLLIENYDLVGLKAYWSYLEKRFFSKLPNKGFANISILENSVLRLYLVHAIQNSKQEKVYEFFDKSASELQNVESWKDWFTLPFVKSPEQNSTFSIYFTRVWQESVMVALYNCISTVFNNMTLPSLLNFEKERKRIEQMKEENKDLRLQIMNLQGEIVALCNEKTHGKKSVAVQTFTVGEECDYLVVSTKTLAPKEPASVPTKRNRWKLKGLAKKQQDSQVLTTIKKKLSYEIQEEGERAIKVSQSEGLPQQNSPRIVLKSSSSKDDLQKSKSIMLDSKKGLDTSSFATSRSFNPRKVRSLTVEESIPPGSYDHFKAETPKPFMILSQDEYDEHLSPIVNCRFAGDGRHVGSIDTEGIIKIWQCHPEPVTQATIASKQQFLSFDWVPKLDGKFLYGNQVGKMSLYDIFAKKTLLDGHVESAYQRIVALTCSPSGASFICSAASGVRKRSESCNINTKRNVQLTQMNSLTDSNRPSTEGTIFEWDMKTFKEKAELALDPYPACVHCMTYNHNGTLLVTGAADGMIRLFDMRTCDCLVGWHAHSSDVLDVQFSFDETSLYSLGADGKLCLWDVHKVSFKIAEFSLHNSSIGLSALSGESSLKQRGENRPGGRLFAFDADGKHMITCATNGAIVFSAESKTSLEQVMTISGQKSAVTSLDWNSSPNSSICVAGQSSGVIQISSLLRM